MHSRIRSLIAVAAAVALLGSATPIPTAQAQQQATHKKSWVQRHPTATGIGAAVVTHRMLKRSAARKKAAGQKLNFAERHPTLTAVGVGVATRNIIKKHTRR